MKPPVEIQADTTEKSPAVIFEKQFRAFGEQPLIPYEQRLAMIKKIEEIICENDDLICRAISGDFGNRSYDETKLLEITPCITGLRHTAKRLKKWMRPQKRHISKLFFGAENVVVPQAKGIVGIIVPWNYPLFLAISPMTSAIAAGNRVMVKPADNSMALSRLLQEKFSEKISGDLISFLPGADPSQFSCLPFNHLVFTGSARVGKIIMRQASDTLTPVTLELGGKSPTILADDFPVKTAVERIMFGKLINSGQTCVAPDYLFVPEHRLETFIELARQVVANRYPDIQSRDYTSIIDQNAFSRLMTTLEDAGQKGARIIQLIPGPRWEKKLKKISPVLLTGVTPDMTIMKEEIFGPFLPVLPYKKIDTVIDYINRHDRPLALYPFSNNRKFIDRVLCQTISGGVSINDCTLQVAQHDMPFGGIGTSGMGHYHGYEGFVEFSKLKPIFKQAKWPFPIQIPFNRFLDQGYHFLKKTRWIS